MRTLESIPLSERDRRAIHAAAFALRSMLPVDRIILFGSKTRGGGGTDSAIDLLVLTSRPLSRDERARVVSPLSPLQPEHGVPFSTLEIPVSEWESGLYRVTPLKAKFERDGVAA
jgi:predicted nucleotidyltransferase